jgi:hypothetical protein
VVVQGYKGQRLFAHSSAVSLLQGKSQSDRVEVDVQLLLSAKDELNQQAQLREDLQQVNYSSSCCCSDVLHG